MQFESKRVRNARPSMKLAPVFSHPAVSCNRCSKGQRDLCYIVYTCYTHTCLNYIMINMYTYLCVYTYLYIIFILYIYIYMVQRRPPPPLWMGHGPPPPLWLWGCGGALLVSDAADFLWFLVPPPPPHGPPPPVVWVMGAWWWW